MRGKKAKQDFEKVWRTQEYFNDDKKDLKTKYEENEIWGWGWY